MATRVGPKGQVVIEQDIRRKLGVQPGWVALQRLVGDHVEIVFLPPQHEESLKGALSQYARNARFTNDAWQEVKAAAWERSLSGPRRTSDHDLEPRARTTKPPIGLIVSRDTPGPVDVP